MPAASFFAQCILLVFIILLLVTLAQRLKIAYPIVLVVSGLILSFIPGIPTVSVKPELIFIIFLPPLLYEAAWYTSWKELWRWRRVVSSFAFIIVIVTSFVIALVSSSLIPGFTLALGFLLGGIVSPPDAVSASAILKYVKAPKRLSSIVEGESLLNDASSLVVFRFALIAVDTGRFIFHEAALNFVIVIVAGIAVGLAIAVIYYYVHKWLPTDSNSDVVLTLTAPYAMYLTAEHFHFSGVLAVVSGSLFLTVRSHLFLSNSSRIRGANVWSALSFVLNGLVFMLIGLELPEIVRQLGGADMLPEAMLYSCIITGALIITRILSTLGASAFTVFISRYITTADSRPGWKAPLVFGWAGMRGVVSLAAALSIPFYLTDGSVFPQRNMILFITFMVILFTLIVQGLTLPLVIKWINLEDLDHNLPEEKQHELISTRMARAGLEYLNNEHAVTLQRNVLLQQVKARLERTHLKLDDCLVAEQEAFRRAYLQMLEKQRAFLRELNKDPGIDEELIRKYQIMLDLEEEKLKLKSGGQ